MIDLLAGSIGDLVAAIVCGLAAGAVNGLLGTGGGIILVFAFGRLMSERHGYGARDVFAAVILAILPMSAFSALMYIKSGSVELGAALPYAGAGALGGLIGAMLLDKINTELLKKLFAVMVIYAGVRMMLG